MTTEYTAFSLLSTILIQRLGVRSQAEATRLIETGNVTVNGVPMLQDNFVQEEDFVMLFHEDGTYTGVEV